MWGQLLSKVSDRCSRKVKGNPRSQSNCPAGSDTVRDLLEITSLLLIVPQTLSTLQTVFLAMSLYPDVLKKAHAELDAVVGPDRLPDRDFDDEKSLVYVSAIIKEAQRWIPAVPTGLPHGTTEDLELRGYLIPAGTILMPNIWSVSRDVEFTTLSTRLHMFVRACMHDPEVFEDPETPSRTLHQGWRTQSERAQPSSIYIRIR